MPLNDRRIPCRHRLSLSTVTVRDGFFEATHTQQLSAITAGQSVWFSKPDGVGRSFGEKYDLEIGETNWRTCRLHAGTSICEQVEQSQKTREILYKFTGIATFGSITVSWRNDYRWPFLLKNP
jgi:hypothetical protein